MKYNKLRRIGFGILLVLWLTAITSVGIVLCNPQIPANVENIVIGIGILSWLVCVGGAWVAICIFLVRKMLEDDETER